ncbi:hypothetical protein ABPG74_016675 [Tetrahymena malaccensis]
MAEQLKKCKRGGCNKQFKESENTGNSCKFHPGKPIFHDTKKGWTCCNKIVYDWDEFSKIEPCAEGMHSDLDPMQAAQGQDGFFKSETVNNAQKAIDKSENKPVIKKISDYNQQDDKKEAQQQQVQNGTEKKVFVTPSGNLKCTNKGCQKEYKEEDNKDDSCKYHAGAPVFHDLKKFWSCCHTVTYDWDDFMKLPTCTVGRHQPKFV